jgi:acetyltransferase-like isoleucine patch superfamily enzyme
VHYRKARIWVCCTKRIRGTGYKTEIAEGVTIRAGAIIYSGTKIADKTSIGHHTLIRSFVEIGENTQLGHFLCIERKTKVGNYVRCSPLSHITSETIIEDRVFIGAGVSTVNDKNMIWKNDDQHPTLSPPHFEFGAKIGSGSTIAAGVRVGKNATVGSGSMVTKDIPSNSVSYGNPAEVKKYKEE